jgi:hypothetical protein
MTPENRDADVLLIRGGGRLNLVAGGKTIPSLARFTAASGGTEGFPNERDSAGAVTAAARVMAVASDRVEATLRGFTRWAREAPQKLNGDPDADAEELRLLLGLLRDHIGVDDPADLALGDLSELLLLVYPRNVTALDDGETANTVPALRDLLAFLAGDGALAPTAAKRLGRELDEVAPRFADAVVNPKNWDDDLEDFDLEDDFDPDDGDFSLKEAFGLPDRLPPVRLPPEPELAAMSRAAPLLARARGFADWLAPGRDITQQLELTVQDMIAAAHELGIPVPVKAGTGPEPGMPEPAAVTSMREVPELAKLWDIALDAGFMDVAGYRAEPGPDMALWPGGTDEEVLEVWSTTLPSVVNRVEADAEFDDPGGWLLDFTGVGWTLMVLLYLARGKGLPVRKASELIREVATDELAPGQAEEEWQAWTQAHGDPAEYLLGMLRELSAISLPDQAPDEGVEEGPVARLTPLGTWAMRELLLEDDVEIPLLAPSDQMTAPDLLAAVEGFDEEEFEAEMAAWLELRAPDVAAGELLTAAAADDPGERLLAVAAVQKLGAAAEPAWRDALARPELRPYAKIALTELAGGEAGITVLPGLEPEAADITWMLVDTLAVTSGDPDESQQQMRDAIPAGQEQQAFDAISLSLHPDAAAVLTLIGKQHPDKQIAKAARRSAYRASSRPKRLS